MSVFLNNSVRVYCIKLKLGTLDHINNTFRNTVFKISVHVPLKIVGFYDIPIVMLKNLCLTFLIKKNMCFTIKTIVKARIEAKKMRHVSKFNQSQWLKPYVKFNTKKENTNRKKVLTKIEKHCTNY